MPLETSPTLNHDYESALFQYRLAVKAYDLGYARSVLSFMLGRVAGERPEIRETLLKELVEVQNADWVRLNHLMFNLHKVVRKELRDQSNFSEEIVTEEAFTGLSLVE